MRHRGRRAYSARGFALALLMSAALAPSLAWAETEPEAPAQTQAAPVQPAASRAQFDAGLDVAAAYSDNIFATRRHEVDDLILILRPTLAYSLTKGQNRLSARAEGEIGRYADYTSENYEDWLVSLDGRYAPSTALTLLGGAAYAWEHESRASPEAVGGAEPTQYGRAYGYGGALLRRGAFATRLAASLTEYDFSDVAALAGVINNDDRDRTQSEFGARAGYRVRPGFELFVQGAYDHREYTTSLDDFGFARNSDGASLAGGVRRTIGGRLNTEFFAGYLHQDYDDPRLSDVGAFDVGAVVDWTGAGGLGASLRLDRSVEETTLPGASSYLLTLASLNLRGSPHPRAQTGVRLTGAHYDYRGHPREELVSEVQLWGRYWLGPRVYAGLDYTLGQRSSNTAGYDYDENRFMVQLGAQLRPRALGAAPFALDDAAPGGGYAGLLVGHGHLVTGLDGPRGPGTNTADFGDLGASYGAVLGYGWVAGRVYVGLEAEAFGDGPDWLHTADRVFSVAERDSLGLAMRLGYLTPARDLLYARAGAFSTTFRTDYLHAANAVSDSERRTGFGAGLGVEAGAGRRGFVRAEYVVASYPDYDVATGGAAFDNFSNAKGQFRIGGGLRFGGARAPAATATTFSGPYVGVEVGHGALTSDNAGERSGGTLVDIERASQGPLLGVFAGYGVTLGRFYAGVEAGADVSDINWNIERDPSGRIYSAQHDHSIVASIRAGWLVSESALLYGRVGAARTRFDIPYQTSGDSVRSKETRTGFRLGAGLELGLGPRTRVRLDYSVTDYEAYDVAYGASNHDSFDHAEGLASIGFVFRP